MFRKTHLGFTLLLAIVLAWSGHIWAQSFFGSVRADVIDTSGAVITGATITLTNSKTGQSVSAVSDASGSYAFVTLLPSTYRMTVEKQGFKTYVQDNITVQVQSSLHIEAQLQPGGTNETVTVTSEAPLIQAEDPTLGQVIADRSVEELPLNGRDVYSLVALSPGVVPQGSSGTITPGSNPFGWSNYSIGGGTANWNQTLIDGAPVNVNYANLTAIVPTQDAVQEFKVQTSALGPEYGHFTGGVINMSTKSGTNQFHGALWEYLRNKVLNANDYFSNHNGIARNPFTQNQYGASLGGPILRQKAFFFFSWEGFSVRQGQTYTYTVPTTSMLGQTTAESGDFSQLPIPIIDPTTGTQFMGCNGDQPNVICPNRLNDSALDLMRLTYPAPTNGNVAQNFVQSTATGGNQNQYNARVDQRIGDKQSIFARYTGWQNNSLPQTLGNRYFRSPGLTLSQQLVAGDTITLNQSTIFDIRAGVLRYTLQQQSPTLGKFNFQDIGWPASYQDQFPVAAQPEIYALSIFFSLPGQYFQDANNSFVIEPSITKIWGKHTFKAGADLRKNQFNFIQSNWPTGLFFDFGVFTHYDMADLELGLPTQLQTTELNKTANTVNYQAYYAGDTYRATRKLTLNYGVRWDLYSPWTERHDRQTSFYPDRPNAVFPQYMGDLELINTPQNPGRYASDPHHLLFSPRAGFTYAINPKTVIRSGFGLYYIPMDTAVAFWPGTDPINSNTQTLIGGTFDFSDPWPNGAGIPYAPGRSPDFATLITGPNSSVSVTQHSFPWGYNQQWNASLERQLGSRSSVTIAYAGSFGVHFPAPNAGGDAIDPLPDSAQKQAESEAAAGQPVSIMQPVSSPLGTVAAGQLLRPFPQYQNVFANSHFNRSSRYNSVQASFQQRFGGGGTVLAAYTYEHLSGNSDSTSSWLEGGPIGIYSGAQNPNNIQAEWSQSNFDTPHRLVLSYVLDLPFGKGKRFASDLPKVANALVSGWGVNGITTFQSGFPLAFAAPATTLSSSFGWGTPRPNVVAGCKKGNSGPATSRLNEWFNTACFTAPGPFSYGNEPRVDQDLRGQGIDNWDFAVFRNFNFTERLKLQFRSEFFNIANRAQFGPPGTTVNSPGQFGVVTTQANSPRLVQFAARLTF
jgi:hypothetical protein